MDDSVIGQFIWAIILLYSDPDRATPHLHPTQAWPHHCHCTQCLIRHWLPGSCWSSTSGMIPIPAGSMWFVAQLNKLVVVLNRPARRLYQMHFTPQQKPLSSRCHHLLNVKVISWKRCANVWKNIAVPEATNTVRRLIDFTILQANAWEWASRFKAWISFEVLVKS